MQFPTRIWSIFVSKICNFAPNIIGSFPGPTRVLQSVPWGCPHIMLFEFHQRGPCDYLIVFDFWCILHQEQPIWPPEPYFNIQMHQDSVLTTSLNDVQRKKDRGGMHGGIYVRTCVQKKNCSCNRANTGMLIGKQGSKQEIKYIGNESNRKETGEDNMQ
jgi:hypothetical protein